MTQTAAATEKQIAYINDLIAGHVESIDAAINSWQGFGVDGDNEIKYLSSVRDVFAAMKIDPDAATGLASNIIATLKECPESVFRTLALNPKRAEALGITVDAKFARRVGSRGVNSR